MSDFTWPSDNDRAASSELDRVCNYLAYTLDKLDALRATNSDLLALYESTRVELGKARARVAELERDVAELEYLDAEAAVGAELAADEIARLKAKLEELEALRAPIILRKQAEAVEQCWTDIADMALSPDVLTPEVAFFKAARYCADYSLRLRKQSEAAGRTGGSSEGIK